MLRQFSYAAMAAGLVVFALFALAPETSEAASTPGWHLVTGEDVSAARYAAEHGPCPGDVSIIWHYDAALGLWMVYDPDAHPFDNTLGYLSRKYGYLVHCGL